MTETAPFRVGIVPGVTVTKWTRAWRERRPAQPLEVVPIAEHEQRAALDDDLVDVCFVRLPLERDGLGMIPLYTEVPVAVVSLEHPIALYDSITSADLEGETLRLEDPADAIEIVAAGAGAVRVPHSVARLHSRKDVVAVPVTDAAETEIALVWPDDAMGETIEFFIGIVRGRTAASSRGASIEPAQTVPGPTAPAQRGKTGGAKTAAKRPAAKKPAPRRKGRR